MGLEQILCAYGRLAWNFVNDLCKVTVGQKSFTPLSLLSNHSQALPRLSYKTEKSTCEVYSTDYILSVHNNVYIISR